MTATVQFTDTQSDSIEAMARWLAPGYQADKPIFRLFGYAGSGKTTIAKKMAADAAASTGKAVAFAAFTGKAASVMRAKGCDGAGTIHGLIYRPVPKNDGKDVDFLLRHGRLHRDRHALIIVDECSMVDARLASDLQSFGVPLLVLGDPFQLPPVGDGGCLTGGVPDVLLTEIHRQKEGCGILDIATAVRFGERLRPGTYEESAVHHLSHITKIDPFEFDQVLVGKNATRQRWNSKMRERMGRRGVLPVKGDKLICMQNNHRLGLMNGEMMVAVSDAVEAGPTEFWMEFVRDGSDRPESQSFSVHYLQGMTDRPQWRGDSDVIFADYGYAITTHKSQGSQWGSVLVINEGRVFGDDAARWLYTAVTRAAKRVEVIL